VFTAPRTPRAAAPTDLSALARTLAPELSIQVATPPLAAVEIAARSGSPVVVAGSLYLVGEIRAGLS
jgi:folylpolyglutamate synthase/dihydropteroate synthase